MKYFISIFILIGSLARTTLGQKPDIVYINKASANPAEIVDIGGSGFPSNSGRLKLFFGAAQAEVISVTENLVKARVPAGASYDCIRAINLDSHLSGSSSEPFLLSFGGKDFLENKLSNQEIYTGASSAALGALNDLCVADLDGDGKNEWIAGHNQTSQQTGLYIVKNNSSPGNISTAFLQISLPSQTSYIDCGDLNNDGKPDLVAVRGGNLNDRIYVLINNSTGVGNFDFLPVQTLIAPNVRVLSKVKIVDLDNDGLPEIVITDNTNQAQNGINDAVHIFKNKSSNGIASFAEAPITIRIQDDPAIIGDESLTAGVFALDAKDLNRDGYPELIIAPLVKPNVCVFVNNSSPGKISFDNKLFLSVGEAISDLKVAEINGDGKPDIVVAKVDASKNFSVFINATGEDRNISFGQAASFPLSRRSASLDVGDLNGDGMADIVFSSVESSNSGICVLINGCSGGTVSFSELVLPVRTRQSPVKIADMDCDGRPDITAGLNDNRLSVFRNRNCISATTYPSGNIVYCAGNEPDIVTAHGINLSYAWQKNGIDLGINTPSLVSVNEGQYRVTISSDNGECSSSSVPVNVTIQQGLAPSRPSIVANNPACEGHDLQFTAQNNGGAVQFQWEGPGNWISNLSNPVVPKIKEQQAGYYLLTAIGANGCTSKKDTLLVSVLSMPVIEISGPDAICNGTEATLEVTDLPGYQYTWKFNGNILAGKTAHAVNVDQVGRYNAIISKSGCAFESNPFDLQSIALPQAGFTAKSEVCVHEEIHFQDNSTIPLERDVDYFWDFGDGGTSNEKNPVYAYRTMGNYEAKLEVSYRNTTCISETGKTINARELPVVAIAAETDIFCAGDSIKLEANGNFVSYEWSTGEKTNFIYIPEGGDYSVSATDANGCTASDTVYVDQYPVSEITISVQEGDTVLDFGKSVQLIASDQYADYLWTPVAGLSDGTISNPVAAPRATTTYLLTARDDNGCKVSNSITIVVAGSAPKLKAAKIFSPNGDLQNDFWEIEDVFSYQDSEVAIFDGSGKIVFEASPYANNWDGTYNGTALPEGVYYYVFKLRESGTVQTGAIMLTR